MILNYQLAIQIRVEHRQSVCIAEAQVKVLLLLKSEQTALQASLAMLNQVVNSIH